MSENSAASPSPVTAAVRIVALVAGVVLVSLWPVAAWRWQVVPLLVLAAGSVWVRPDGRQLVRRLVLVWMLVGLVSLGLLGRPEALLRAGNLWLKSSLSLWAVSLLTASTPLPALIGGLRRLGLPGLWTESLSFWARYHSVLGEEWHRLQLARRARTFSPNRARTFRLLTQSLGLLFIRAYERAEQVHRAMLARGYRGES